MTHPHALFRSNWRPAHLATSTRPRGSSAVRLSEPQAPAFSRSWVLVARTGKYAPRDGPASPVTPHVFARRRQLFPARTHFCHHHGPAAIWQIVLIACHLHLAEIGPRLFWCPILPMWLLLTIMSQDEVDYHPPGSPPLLLPLRPCHPDATLPPPKE